MDEYIKREEAIEAAKHAWAKGLEPSQYLEIIPEADVVPVRHGRWIASHDEFCACSICKYPVYAGWNQTNYCPNCGARMVGGAD